jgi:ATP-dependent Lhr-like helicase
VVLVDGELGAWLSRGVRQVLAWMPEDEPDRTTVGEAVAGAILAELRGAMGRGEGTIVAEVNGGDPAASPLGPFLLAAGLLPSSLGLQLTRRAAAAPGAPADLH